MHKLGDGLNMLFNAVHWHWSIHLSIDFFWNNVTIFGQISFTTPTRLIKAMTILIPLPTRDRPEITYEFLLK